MASTREWFETVEEARRRAKRRLPRSLYMALEAGTGMGLSSCGSMPVEAVAQVNPKLFFQTYWSGSRDQIVQRTERARQAGAKGLIVTLDWSFSNGRDWGSPPIPEKMDLRAILRFAPEGIVRPGYVRECLRHGGLPDLTVPNRAAPG